NSARHPLSEGIQASRFCRGPTDVSDETHRTPIDVSALVPLLAGSGELVALAERFAKAGGASRGVGEGLRHVTYAALPRGAKAPLAAALAAASGERLLWIARDAEAADRAADELQAWLGDPSRVIVLEPRTALPYERSELVRDETAARVAALAAWRRRDSNPSARAGDQLAGEAGHIAGQAPPGDADRVHDGPGPRVLVA